VLGPPAPSHAVPGPSTTSLITPRLGLDLNVAYLSDRRGEMHFLLLILAHAYLVSAALFPKDSKVRIINHRQFNNVMNQNVRVALSIDSPLSDPQRTMAIAFVAPWCGVRYFSALDLTEKLILCLL
jgi:hypothetical protein